jgi:undecaprenyl phosphate N,N'-diacetylbacillosamine 1-phosphate transferase
MYSGIKAFFDVSVSIVLILLLSPVFIAITISLFFLNKGKPFFFQKRPGLKGKVFKIIKFKTMTDKVDADNNLLPDAMRLTRVGSFIRKTSLDEIPQLLNVIVGQMSLVGPRPLLVEYLGRYTKEQSRRHDVKPGITGWAQVNGRNAISWEDKFEYDIWYVDNRSFFLDVKILFNTVKKVFTSKDITADGQATTTKFKGN